MCHYCRGILVGLTERLTYLSIPYKRPQPPSPYSANNIPDPLAKKPPKDARPVLMHHPCIVVGEDKEAHSRNVKMLQSLSFQVKVSFLVCAHTVLII